MKVLDEKTIQLERELSELDLFVLRFTTILEEYTPYVLISGYVAILFGRTRTTEDVDVFIPQMAQSTFHVLYSALRKQGFWALNADSEKELYSLLESKIAVRFAEQGKVAPNVEVKFVKDALDELTLKEKVQVRTTKGILWTSKIEMQVAYKKYILKSAKDVEDARHLQKLFNLSEENINKYRGLFKLYGRI